VEPDQPAGSGAGAVASSASEWARPTPPASDAPPAPGGRPEKGADGTSELPAEPQTPLSPGASAAAAAEAALLSEYLEGKPAALADLFSRLDEYGRGLDATRRIGRASVEYLRGDRRFLTLEVQPERVLLCLTLDREAVRAWWWSPGAETYTIDVRERGRDQMEYSVGEPAHLDNARQLIKLAYNGSGRSGA
jgi:hypothetical protein